MARDQIREGLGINGIEFDEDLLIQTDCTYFI
jgi:hypothetical protein